MQQNKNESQNKSHYSAHQCVFYACICTHSNIQNASTCNLRSVLFYVIDIMSDDSFNLHLFLFLLDNFCSLHTMPPASLMCCVRVVFDSMVNGKWSMVRTFFPSCVGQFRLPFRSLNKHTLCTQNDR